MLFGECFSLLVTNDSEVFQIGFVSSDGDDDFGGGVLLELLDPFFDPFERLS